MERVRIYQLFVRLFGNTNGTNKPNGSLAENGCGKFADINAAALASVRGMGFTHIWLTGVLRQATGTDYSAIGLPADDPDLLKGIAGSPYAIRDYFDVCPDYASDPARRMEEFKELVARIHDAGMKVIIDLVGNHVARSYDSVVRPEMNFGANDDRGKFFDPKNNFFYLTPGFDGPPLRLPTVRDGAPVSPTCKVEGMHCDGLYEGEKTFGRVTGNNAPTWSPGINDWYETVKLNYGWDFTNNHRAFPCDATPGETVPDTWTKMDAVIGHWQAMGVDGFRCDMAHMVPVEFWDWAIKRARVRNTAAYFVAEGYDNDPAKAPCPRGGNVLVNLLNAGFDSVYDDPVYKVLKRIYDGPSWANDIDSVLQDQFLFTRALRYAENHDEVRLAATGQWGGIGMEVGRAVCGILYGLSRGPVMLYNGQELGENAANGAAGFGGGNARTSIFDYGSMPEFAKWVNGHRYDGGGLTEQQRELREFYKRLLALTGEPAFRDGDFFPLNPANNGNRQFGSMENDPAGGHWMYAFLRYAPGGGQRFLVVVNLHRENAFRKVPVLFSWDALRFLGITDIAIKKNGHMIEFKERLAGKMNLRITLNDLVVQRRVEIPEIPALMACYFEIGV